MTAFLRRWWMALFLGAAGLTFAVLMVLVGNIASGVLIGLALLIPGWLVSPALFPRSRGWAASARSATDRAVPLILWKPGCSYCVRLRLALGVRGGRAVWVDIWSDPTAAAETRRLNGGDETTPTVITVDETRTNPDPTWVRARLPG